MWHWPMKQLLVLLSAITMLHCSVFGQKKYEMVIKMTNGSESAINVEDIESISVRERNGGDGESSYTSCPDANHPHLINLGLPSGTKWACCNVGAKAPEEYGDYYAWGETVTKSKFTWDTYQYGHSTDDLVNIGSEIAGTKYDVATVKWGASWRMPTFGQYSELMRNCKGEWTSKNGVYGCKLTGPNGGTIFLPATGRKTDNGLWRGGERGFYWSSSFDEEIPGALDLVFSSQGFYFGCGDPYDGHTARPVR